MNSEEIKQLTERFIEQLVESLRQGKSESLVEYLRMAARFRRHRLHNVLLIALQKPNASYVAGFRAWQKLGRFVRKGEKGILILASILKRVVEADSCRCEVETKRIIGFRSAYIFDDRHGLGRSWRLPLPAFGLCRLTRNFRQEFGRHRSRARYVLWWEDPAAAGHDLNRGICNASARSRA